MKRLTVLVLVAACGAPHTPVAVRPVEEAGRAATGPAPTVTRSPMPRVRPSAASRSRSEVDPAPRPARTHRRHTGHKARGSVLEVTCYSSGSLTASGKHVVLGMAAANAYRFGTRLDVEGVGVVTVEDRSAPGATDVDIYNPSESYCRSFGRRHLHVEVAS